MPPGPDDLDGLNEHIAHLIFSMSTISFTIFQFSLDTLLGGTSSDFFIIFGVLVVNYTGELLL